MMRALIVGMFAGWLLTASLIACTVGDRAPSPSLGVPHATATPVLDSEAAPARPRPSNEGTTVQGGNGEDGLGGGVTPISPAAESASTVTQALTVTPVVTAVATARPVVTQVVESSNLALITASPWPVHLHATVACLVQRESRWDAGAVGAAGERGLLQAHPVTWPYLAQHGIAPDMLFDPATNLRAGYLLYLEAGSLRPWTTRGGCA